VALLAGDAVQEAVLRPLAFDELRLPLRWLEQLVGFLRCQSVDSLFEGVHLPRFLCAVPVDGLVHRGEERALLGIQVLE